MPIYPCTCDECGYEIETLQLYREKAPPCSICGAEMRRKPTFPVMVKIKGAGGYPSRRKYVGGTAPYTTRESEIWIKPNDHMKNTDETRPNWVYDKPEKS